MLDITFIKLYKQHDQGVEATLSTYELSVIPC